MGSGIFNAQERQRFFHHLKKESSASTTRYYENIKSGALLNAQITITSTCLPTPVCLQTVHLSLISLSKMDPATTVYPYFTMKTQLITQNMESSV